MANLACVGSRRINGVARLHTELLRKSILADFNRITPEKFLNVTNGVTPRRFILLSNPGLASLITDRIGQDWIRDLSCLRGLETHAQDGAFLDAWQAVKRRNKERLAGIIRERTGVAVDPGSLFDIQVKRIHEYKRQSLNILQVVATYLQLKHDPHVDLVPRTFLIGGKAAPGYHVAKQIIQLVGHVSEVVNADPHTRDRLRVAFLPNYRVSLAEKLFPAADVSEQISTAGLEASGTGNMKFAMNGALTLGTLDGANVEIRGAVGDENCFIFGLTAQQVAEYKPHYEGWRHLEDQPLLRETLELISGGYFSPHDRGLFRPLVDRFLGRDPYLVLADFADYRRAQAAIDRAYRNADQWSRMALLNIARSGMFSSDRTILEYNRDIWHAEPVDIDRA
jgi:starch phosphorylase